MDRTIEIHINTANAAFSDPLELPRIIAKIAKNIDNLDVGEHYIIDHNGNGCGFVRITD